MDQDNPQTLSTPLVLIVEDDPSLSKMYSIRIEKEGYRVSIAHDGASGLEKAATENPSLILLDMMLPKYSGIEFLEQLNQHEEIKNVPVLALTNLTEKKEADRARELGVKEYLAKAMHTPEEVVVILKKYLSPNDGQASNQNTPGEE